MKLLSALLIDNEVSALTDVQDSLDETGLFTIVGTFQSVSEAKRFLMQRNERVDVIFCDIEMPDCSGLEAIGFLRAYCRFFVFCTGFVRYAMVGHELLVDGYLLKPIEEQRVLDLVEKFRNRDAQSQLGQAIIDHFLLDQLPDEADLVVIEKPSESDQDVTEKRRLVKKRTDGVRKREWKRVAVRDVAFMKKKGNYIYFYGLNTARKKVVLGAVDGDMKTLYAKYQALENLFPINQSEIVNADYITDHLAVGLMIGDVYFSISDMGRPYYERYLAKVVPNYPAVKGSYDR